MGPETPDIAPYRSLDLSFRRAERKFALPSRARFSFSFQLVANEGHNVSPLPSLACLECHHPRTPACQRFVCLLPLEGMIGGDVADPLVH